MMEFMHVEMGEGEKAQWYEISLAQGEGYKSDTIGLTIIYAYGHIYIKIIFSSVASYSYITVLLYSEKNNAITRKPRAENF